MSSFSSENKIDCKKDKSKLNNKAHQILLTLNPLITLSANKIISALMINRKSPKVTMVMGRVKMTKMGLTKKLSRLSTMATSIAVK